MKIYAGVAQLVEQLIRNQQVVGSSPIFSSNKIRRNFSADLFFVILFYYYTSFSPFFQLFFTNNRAILTKRLLKK